MEVPIKIKRRMTELERMMMLEIDFNPTLGKNSNKEFFIHSICRNMSIQFIYRFYPEFMNDYRKVEEYIPIMKYIFRTKLTLYWEKLNGK